MENRVLPRFRQVRGFSGYRRWAKSGGFTRNNLPLNPSAAEVKSGGIALQHVGGGHELQRADGSLTCWCALVAGEEEKLVLFDGAAYRTAELVPLKPVGTGREAITGVRAIVAHECEQIPVKTIGTGF